MIALPCPVVQKDAAVIIWPNINEDTGLVEGKHTSPGQKNATRDLSTTGANALGTGEQESLQFTLSVDGDVPVDLKTIETRFNQATVNRYKPEVQPKYVLSFSNLWKGEALEGYTKRQLAGPKGKQLILDHLQKMPRGSWRPNISKMKSVWKYGLGLPWPLDNKVDLGRLPKSRPEPTPPDQAVREWAETIAREKDPYLKLVWLLIAQHGWRPSHATGVRWSDLKYDVNGRPNAIIASGAGAEFKSYAPVAVWLAPNLVQALEDWRKVHPNPNGNAFILPFRGLKRELDSNRKMQSDEFRWHWNALQKKYGLPKLRPKDLRHWVSTACRKAGLSKRASAYLQGHDADGGTSMRDWYDNVPLEEILQEQADVFPSGPLATVLPVDVELVSDLPPEAVALLSRFLTGELDSYEFLPQIVELRKRIEKPARMTV